MKPHEKSEMLTIHSLNVLRLCVKYNLLVEGLFFDLSEIVLDDDDQAIAGTASASDKKLGCGPTPG